MILNMGNEIINSYFESKEIIYDMFKYEENEQSCIEDYRDNYWMLIDDDSKVGKLIIGCDRPVVESGNSFHWAYNYLHFNIYKTQDHTMVKINTKHDICGNENKNGGSFLFIFSNHLECKDAVLKKIYRKKLIEEIK
jgi:hypothetical protein